MGRLGLGLGLVLRQGLGLALGLQLRIGIGFRRNHSWSSTFTPRRNHSLCLSQNIDQFSKFFHCYTQEKVCSTHTMKHSTTPSTCFTLHCKFHTGGKVPQPTD